MRCCNQRAAQLRVHVLVQRHAVYERRERESRLPQNHEHSIQHALCRAAFKEKLPWSVEGKADVMRTHQRSLVVLDSLQPLACVERCVARLLGRVQRLALRSTPSCSVSDTR